MQVTEWAKRRNGARANGRDAWRGAALARAQESRRICSVMITAEKRAPQAAPAIDPALRSSTGPRRKRINEALGEASRWVISGSHLLSRFQARLAI